MVTTFVFKKCTLIKLSVIIKKDRMNVYVIMALLRKITHAKVFKIFIIQIKTKFFT